MKTFHEWKQEQLAIDKRNNNGTELFRPREWYWDAYGKYVKKERAK